MRDLSCKFITCDTWFHYTKCLLKQIYSDLLYDKFKEAGLQFPDVALTISTSCNKSKHCQYQKDNRHHDYEELEAEATRLAEQQLSSIDIQAIYEDCLISELSNKINYIEKRTSELKLYIDDLNNIKQKHTLEQK